MSKKMSVINDSYKTRAENARRTLNNAQKLSITSFPEPVEVPKGHFDADDTWKAEPSKYQYNGCGERNTMAEANNDRNADIDSKIAILDSRIAECNARKGELGEVKSDCNDSLANLNSDVETLNSANSQLESISSSIISGMSQYNGATDSLHNAYECGPKNLGGETLSAIDTTRTNLSSDAISSCVSSLQKWISMGETILSGIASLETQLETKITELINQRNQFQGMKH